MKKLKILLGVVLVCFCLVGRWGEAAAKFPEVNKQSFFAQDNANVLTAETRGLINKIGKELQTKTKAQIVAVTIDSLQGENLEEYSNQFFRKLELGDKATNNGLLFLIAVKDHKLRIEVGYGLEGAVTDGFAGSVRDKYIVPAFKKNDFNKGIQDGYIALAQKVAASYKVELESLKSIPKVEKKEPTSEEAADADDDLLISFGIIAAVVIISIIVVIKKMQQPAGHGKKHHGKSDNNYDDNDSFWDSGDSGGGGSSGGGGASGDW
jgi:uncharacterized protein